MTRQTTQQSVPVTGTGGVEQQYGQQTEQGQRTGQETQTGQGRQMGQETQMGPGTQSGQGTQMGQGVQTGQGMQSGQGASTQARTLEDDLTDGMRIALHDATEAANTSEWCADECISEGSPEMSECIRLCRDVADLASLTARFIARGSLFGPEVAETFAMAAEECARECAHHPHAHCQETAYVLQRAADSTWALLDEISGQQHQQQQPVAPGGA